MKFPRREFLASLASLALVPIGRLARRKPEHKRFEALYRPNWSWEYRIDGVPVPSDEFYAELHKVARPREFIIGKAAPREVTLSLGKPGPGVVRK